jgi:NAD(P)-dependent dehydrogenase (short-subunit alcohol dehydrogenase family)
MSELRFDGRVAIVTGAGGNPSMGRAHALLLASRGAKVVVNDIGKVKEVPGYAGTASADAVVAEIRAAGGEAVADTNDISNEAGANALIRTAIDAFGAVDILVNNAAICMLVPLDEMTSRDYQRHIDVNLMGAVWTSRAAWPHMKAKGYGRIVNIGSGGFAGTAYLSAYGASKGGLFSLTRTLAAEGKDVGIKANTVHPHAFTRMLEAQHHESSSLFKEATANQQPELVSPLVAFLAHENCPVTGETINSGSGRVWRTYVAETPGFTDRSHSVETLAARWGEVMNTDGSRIAGINGFDAVTGWDLKPYKPVQG